MPLPPSRKDVTGPPPLDTSDLAYVVRHLSSASRQVDPGLLAGRAITPRPVLGGPSQIVGDDDTGSGGADEILFENRDRAVATAGGTIVLHLTYEPIDESLHIRWNGIDQPPLEWTLDGQTVTFVNAHIRVDDVLTAAYAYYEDDEAEGADLASVYLQGAAPNLWLVTPSSEYGVGFSDIYGHYPATLKSAGVGASWFFYIVVREEATDTVVINYIDNASFWSPNAAGPVTKDGLRTGMHANANLPVVIGGGYFVNTQGPGSPGYHAAQALPQDNPDGRYGVTDMDMCAYYWGEQIAITGDYRGDPIGPFLAGAP